MKKVLALVFVCLVLFVSMADARTFKVSYTEPTTNEDGSALTDLGKCSVYYQIPSGTATKAWDQTATAPTGGGTITDKDVVVAVAVTLEEQVDFWGTCSDTGNNESGISTKVRLKISPKFPIGIIVK
jgi:hypothetical protein